jgi:hypothetical protein
MCETRWVAIISSFRRNSEQLAENHPDCTEEIALLHTDLKTIGQLFLKSPPVNGNGSTWKELLDKAVSERAVLCKHLDGNALFTAMLRMYAAIYREMRDSLQLGNQHSEEFREQKRLKQIPSKEQPRNETITIRKDPTGTSQGEVPTRNFFATLKTEMDVERTPVEETTDGPKQSSQKASSRKQGRPHPLCSHLHLT